MDVVAFLHLLYLLFRLQMKHERLPYPATEIMANKNIVQHDAWK